MNEQFKLKDIKSGYVVELRDRTKCFVVRCRQNEFKKIFVDKNERWVISDNYKADLTCSGYPALDIMKIFGLSERFDKTLSTSVDNRPLLWERIQEVEMTMDEVCTALGKQVKIVEKH